jgi:hypothetical protein
MSRSLGIISASFALKSRALALGGHVVFYLFDCHFDSRWLRRRAIPRAEIQITNWHASMVGQGRQRWGFDGVRWSSIGNQFQQLPR